MKVLAEVMELLVSVLLVCGLCDATQDAKRLHDILLRKRTYNKLVQPRMDSPLTVKMGLKLAQIIDVDEKNEIITMNMFVVQEWYDYRLSWIPEEYGGLTVMHIPSESIWLPDIVLYNNGDGDYTVTLMTKASVTYDGRVNWEPPAIYKSQCNINVDYFPFDEQDCHMKFGCWTYDGDAINLVHVDWDANTVYNTTIDPGIDLEFYCNNREWDLLSVVARKNIIYYTCCKEPFLDITYNIKMRRRNTHFYTVNILLPIVSMNLLCVLAFNLPAESVEKISLCISILLSLSLFQMMLTEFMPATSLTVPLLGQYILFTCVVVTLSVFSSVMVLNVHFRSTLTHNMSHFTKKVFFHILPRILCMHKQDPQMSPFQRDSLQWSFHQSDLANYENPYKRKFKPLSQHDNNSEDEAFGSNSTLHTTSFVGYDQSTIDLTAFCELCSPQTYKFPPNVMKAMDGASYIAKHKHDKAQVKRLKYEWKYVGLVVDRLLLWIYASVCVISAVGILLNAPALYDQKLPMCDINDSNRTICRCQL